MKFLVRTFWMSLCVVAISLLANVSPALAKYEIIYTKAAADGQLKDTNRDGQIDTKEGVDSKGLAFSSGAMWGPWVMAITEFELPTAPSGQQIELDNATFRLAFHGKNGCYPDEPGAGPTCNLWVYTGETANGTIEIADAQTETTNKKGEKTYKPTGQDLGVFIKNGEMFLPIPQGNGGQLKDVTKAVQQAMQAGEKHIGFRVQAAEEIEDQVMTWLWRAREFGDKYGLSSYAPQLQLRYHFVPIDSQGSSVKKKRSSATINEKIKVEKLLPPVKQTSEVEIYPTGSSNTRKPYLPLVESGAKGKCASFKGVKFTYQLAPHIGGLNKGKLSTFFRVSKRYEAKIPLLLSNGKRAIAIKISSADKGYVASLIWVDNRYANDARYPFTPAYVRAVTKTNMSMDMTWTKVELQWGQGLVRLAIAGKEVAVIKISPAFAPTQLLCDAYAVDELKLVADGSLSLDWEDGYAAKIRMRKQHGKLTAKNLGFDTKVISTDPDSRHYPMIQVINSSNQDQKIAVHFENNREVAKAKNKWTQTILVKAKSQTLAAIKFPFLLTNDVYHLTSDAKSEALKWSKKNHFMYVKRRDELAGPEKFGFHNYTASNIMGYWPDPLPIDIAHRYINWGFVEGPSWVKSVAHYFRDHPARSESKKWAWINSIDWAIAAGRTPYLCVQSVPYANWQRIKEVSHMQRYPWGSVGGLPDLKRYRNFIETVVERYKDTVKYWEMENEPNAHLRDYPESYAALAKVNYEVIKKAIPDATVFGICGTSDFTPWMKKVFDAGGAPYMDGIVWHTYTAPKSPDEIDLLARLNEALQVINKAKPNSPIIFNSETGVAPANRLVIDHAISAKRVQQFINDGHPVFTKQGFPSYVMDEWTASASLVTNTVYNFLAGVKGYMFFGWNPKTRTRFFTIPWEKLSPSHSYFAMSKDMQRTPSLVALSLGIFLTELEAATLDDIKMVKQRGVRGAVFHKADGGQVAVLWAPKNKQTVMLKTSQTQIEQVSMLGQSHVIDLSAQSDKLVAVALGVEPIYIHLNKQQVSFLDSPIEMKLLNSEQTQKGKIKITLKNIFQSPWVGELTFHQPKQCQLSNEKLAFNLEPGQTITLNLGYQLASYEHNKKYEIQVFTTAPTQGNIINSVNLHREAARKFTLKLQKRSLDLAYMKKGGRGKKTLLLNKPEHVVFGRPPAMTALVDPNFWMGSDDLSAEIRVAANQKELAVYLKVNDAYAKLPKNKHGVGGSVVELFLDFRDSEHGLASHAYSKGVFQLVVYPNLSNEKKPTKFWIPKDSGLNTKGIKVESGRVKGQKQYWMIVRIPWKVARPTGGIPTSFGFDVALDGPYTVKDGRRIQMVLFGDSMNCLDASNFGKVMLPQP